MSIPPFVGVDLPDNLINYSENFESVDGIYFKNFWLKEFFVDSK